ncbi:MAG TPA: hypothetical protein PKY59_07615 [Pyrinomonadaceae bacterium]|nr:hypothetical protein [Pyrinomonadaceae bacterium]
MGFMLPGYDDQWGENPVEVRVPKKPLQLTLSDDLTEAKAVIKQLNSALHEATQIRGIYAALNDPLLLQSERQKLKNRYLQIEANIKAAIETSRRFLK